MGALGAISRGVVSVSLAGLGGVCWGDVRRMTVRASEPGGRCNQLQ